MSREPLVNKEMLETLVYHRSKQWSSLMKSWVEDDEGRELCVSDLEEIFKDEHEDPEMDGVEAEEAIEDPVPETKVDMGNISASMGVAELTLILCAGEDNEAKAEMQEILNQTMPVVQEHKRTWKEAGLDRILDTFDEKQIEKHVGQWMRRNNSTFLEEEARPAKCLYVLDHASISEVSDNESLHSIDTARYIRQSRRRVPNKISNTATIKMYRTHSHKRDELRAKYAYDDEQEHHHHMQTLLHRRREKERKVTYVSASPQQCLLSSGHHSRRKHRRKRHATLPVFDFSSSEEDDRSYGRCACRSCLTPHRSLSRSASYQYCSYRGARDYHHHHHSVASRTMHHLRRQHSYDVDLDLRPRVRENECNCCTSDRLCSNVVHIANSSTEEWVVENCSPLVVQAPKEYRRQQQQKHQLVAITKSNSKSTLSKYHKQRLPKIVKTAAVSKLLKAQVSLLGESTDDEDEKPRKIKPVAAASASAPATVRKAIEATPLTFKQKQVTPKQNEGLINPKRNPVDTVQSSDECEDDVRGRSRLIAKKAQIKSGQVGSIRKKTPSSNKPIFRSTKRLAKIPEELTRAKDPEDQADPAPSTQTCKDNNTCSAEKTSSNALETTSKQVLDEQQTEKKSKISAQFDSSKTNAAGTSSKSRGRPKKPLDSGQKVATPNEGPIAPKIGPDNIGTVQSSDETEDEVKGRSRLVSFSKAKDLKKVPRTVKVAVDSASPKKAGRSKKSPAALTKKKQRTTKASSSDVANEKVQSPDSQETVAEKVKAPKAKVQKSKRVKSSNSASVDEAPDSGDSEFQRALALSAETYKEEEMKRAKDEEATTPENQSQSQSQSQLVFNHDSVACNSTALANDTASTRLLAPKKSGSKRAAAVSSTEAHPVAVISLDSTNESVVEKGCAAAGDADCTVVTSTTICEPPAAFATRKPPPLKIDKRGILLHNSSSAEGGANFTLTEKSLGEVIGERFARRYLKYHVGNRTFDSSHSVYYQPTPKLAKALRAASMDTQLLEDLSTSGSSDDDVFDRINKYGEVYSVPESGVKHKD